MPNISMDLKRVYQSGASPDEAPEKKDCGDDGVGCIRAGKKSWNIINLPKNGTVFISVSQKRNITPSTRAPTLQT